MNHFRLAALIVTLTTILLGANAVRGQDENRVYLPMLASSGTRPQPTTPPAGSLPAELAGTWFSGQVLNRQLYNRDTGLWSDPGGLGHMYTFSADGSYSLASYLKLGEGTLCVSTVWKYHTGTARVNGATLELTPNYARTRTQIVCGSHSDSETEGPYTTTSIPWQVGRDDQGHTRLRLVEAQGETLYYKDGIAPQVLGGWRTGELTRAGFYDPASGQWGDPSGLGEWYSFEANGRYQRGKVSLGYGGDCQQAVLLYEEGALGGSGSDLTMRTTLSLRRTIDLCDQSQVLDETPATGRYERWNWRLTEGESGEVLGLLRIEGGFQQIVFERDQ
jgi:hypothetical protein